MGVAVAVYFADDQDAFLTEVQYGSKVPSFSTPFLIVPILGSEQLLRFVLYEMNDTTTSLEDCNIYGECEVALGEIITGYRPSEITKSGCEIRFVAENPTRRDVLSLVVAFARMPADHWLWKNSPRLAVLREDGLSVFESEAIERRDAGQWAAFSIARRLICVSDDAVDGQLMFVVRDGRHEIGRAGVTLKQLANARNLQLDLAPARSGVLLVRAGAMFEKPTLFGQLRRGLRLVFGVGVDFSSRHAVDVRRKNPYEDAIEAFGAIIAPWSGGAACYGEGFGALLHRKPDILFGRSNTPQALVSTYAPLAEKVSSAPPARVMPSTRRAFALAPPTGRTFLVWVLLLQSDPEDIDEFAELVVSSDIPVYVVGIGISNVPLTRTRDAFAKLGAKGIFAKFQDIGTAETLLGQLQPVVLDWLETHYVD
jgi:hypothetical protein